jgi:hypothetical protein
MTREKAIKKLCGLSFVNAQSKAEAESFLYDIYTDFNKELKLANDTISTQHRLMKNGENRGYVKANQDFESRKCVNCKYLNSFDRCTKGVQFNNVTYNGEIEDSSNTFGCSKWRNKNV